MLKPHRCAPNQPKNKIDVVYGSAEGRTATARQVARSIRLLETVAEHAADDFARPAPFTLEMQSCGFPNARWDLATHKLTLCYELAREFADLYRDYGGRKRSRPPRRSGAAMGGRESWRRWRSGVRPAFAMGLLAEPSLDCPGVVALPS